VFEAFTDEEIAEDFAEVSVTGFVVEVKGANVI